MEEKPRKKVRGRSAKKKGQAISDIENPEGTFYNERKDSIKEKNLAGGLITVQDAGTVIDTSNMGPAQPSHLTPEERNGPSTSAKQTEPIGETSEIEVIPINESPTNGEALPPRPPSGIPSNLQKNKLKDDTDSRPSSATRSGMRRNVVEPINPVMGSSVSLRQGLGSTVSLQSRISKEAWLVNDTNVRPSSSASSVRPGSRPMSGLSQKHPEPSLHTEKKDNEEAENPANKSMEMVKQDVPATIVPPDMNEAHAYVPYTHARDAIAKMMNDMRNMKKKHITIIAEIEHGYRGIEKETQDQFNIFVLGLRQQYGSKVKTFKQVIEVHRKELTIKENYWDEAIASLTARNKQLLEDKKVLLLKNKTEREEYDKEREDLRKSYTKDLDDKNKQLHAVNVQITDEQQKYQDDISKKQAELDQERLRLMGLLEAQQTENQRLKNIIDDLKNRPETAAMITAAVVAEARRQPDGVTVVPVNESVLKRGKGIEEDTEETTTTKVIVTDLSEFERNQMEEERKKMKDERQKIQQERDDFASERKCWKETEQQLRDDLARTSGELTVLAAKYDALKVLLDDRQDWRLRYEKLISQYEAVVEVAKVNTVEEKDAAKDAYEVANKQKIEAEEKQQNAQQEVQQWEKDYKIQHGREPTVDDRSTDVKQMYENLEASNTQVMKLDAKVETLEALRKGDLPPPPAPVAAPEVKEPVVQTVEVKVRDPQQDAELANLQKELKDLKKKLEDTKTENDRLKDRIAALEKELEALQAQPVVPTVQPMVASAPVVADNSEELESLRQKVKDKEQELQDMEQQHRLQTRKLEKLNKSMERDLTKVLKALAKAKKSAGDPRMSKLLKIVVEQVREINSDIKPAVSEVDRRLEAARVEKTKSRELQEQASDNMAAWEKKYETKNGRPPTKEDIGKDGEGQKFRSALNVTKEKADDDDLLVEALTLIQTGASQEEEPDTPEKDRKTKRTVHFEEEVETHKEEEVEILEQEVSNLEKKVDELEDKIATIDGERAVILRNNKELEENLEDLRTQLEKLKAEIENRKQNEQRLQHSLEESKIQHDLNMKEKQREHEKEVKDKDESHKVECGDMEKDIKKLVKHIDKLQKKLKDKETEVRPAESELGEKLRLKEAEVEELQDKMAELEDQLKDLEAEKQDLKKASKRLEEVLEEVETQVSTKEVALAQMEVSASANAASAAELSQLKKKLEEADNRVKELEQELRVKNKDIRELEFEHEKQQRDKDRELKEMKSDIEKLVKLIAKLKAEMKEKKGEIDALKKDILNLTEDVRDRDHEIEQLRAKLAQMGEEAVVVSERQRLNKTKEQEYEDIITELRREVVHLQEEASSNDDQAQIIQLKNTIKELTAQLEAAKREIAEVQSQADTMMSIQAAQQLAEAPKKELKNYKQKVKELEELQRQNEKDLKEKDVKIQDTRNDYERQLREKEAELRELKADMKKMMKQHAALKKKAAAKKAPAELLVPDEAAEDTAQLEKQMEELEDKLQDTEYKLADIESENRQLKREQEDTLDKVKKLQTTIDRLKSELAAEKNRVSHERPLSGISAVTPIPLAASTPHPEGLDLEDLTNNIEELQQQVNDMENKLRQEKSSHDQTKQELEAFKRQLQDLRVKLDNQKSEMEAQIQSTNEKKDSDIRNLQKKLQDSKKRQEALEEQQLKSLPPDAVEEIKQLRNKIAALEKDCDTKDEQKSELSAKVRELIAQLKSLENSSKNQNKFSSEAEMKLIALRQEKDREIKTLQAQFDKKDIERQLQEKKRLAVLELKIRELQQGRGAAPKESKTDDSAKGDGKELQLKLRDANRANQELANHIKTLEKELKQANKAGGGGGGSEIEKKKQEKLAAELMKQLDYEKSKVAKNEENLKKKEEQIKTLEKDGRSKDTDIQKLTEELAALKLQAKAGAETAAKLAELEKESKRLIDENKTLAENYNSERVLRKKYYNMVEDMKGKIRVYARVRPMSTDEKNRGNFAVIRSPDEYTIQIDAKYGLKEWQFDQIFMPDSSQEKIFEDTNNLIQSAVDGYNVCIFAYGQTGSGKTFTIIGDREKKYLGIAPRAFERIFSLLEENKSKFKYEVTCYMLELYNERLLDLFSKSGQTADEKLEIKKDKKNMVVIQGAEVKTARNAKELYALFEEGSKTRHTASTKMNAESSRSHLVIGILIETTSLATGQIVKGKLSLVDLAGSERAAKTGATPEQLKEAMSINKSLSALGDVISALSSEQSFIPYRNNKLTMLMQDSLGGNAKTLMFVNVSPADYNMEESTISLTYASRVKLITNDAQKNSENKEIARLKGIIAKLKSGAVVVEEEVDLE